MTSIDKIEQLQDIADSLGGTFMAYSGRFMYGKKCPGVVVSDTLGNRVIEMAAQDGIVGSRTDQMGLSEVVIYYPGITIENPEEYINDR